MVKPILDPAISAQIYETVDAADTDIENYKAIRDEMRTAISSLLKVMIICNCNLCLFWSWIQIVHVT